MSEAWDPMTITTITPDPRSLKRRVKEVADLIENPIDGVQIIQDENCMHFIHVLIDGVKDSPYEGGFFYFLMAYPENYPFTPFKVKFMTTGVGQVRFNPNLYNCGKVCLSILGTWSGPEWSAAHNLRSTIISLQALMNETPLINEPGYDKAPTEKIKAYNNYVHHETHRIAVISNIETSLAILVDGKKDSDAASKTQMPTEFRKYMLSEFFKKYDSYVKECTKKTALDGKEFESAFIRNCTNKYKYEQMIKEMKELYPKVKEYLSV
jgi:ubiquitin-conjugating enzyme E2 Z